VAEFSNYTIGLFRFKGFGAFLTFYRLFTQLKKSTSAIVASKRFPRGKTLPRELVYLLPNHFCISKNHLLNIICAMAIKKVIGKNQRGQASTEYLLTITAILLAFSGIAVLFSNQINNYLSLLFQVMTLPF
jgi:hypothetical protein